MGQAIDWTAVGSIAGLGAMVVAWLQYRSSSRKSLLHTNTEVTPPSPVPQQLAQPLVVENTRTDLTYRAVTIRGDMPNYVKYDDDDYLSLSLRDGVVGVKFSFDSPARDIERTMSFCWRVGPHARIWSFRVAWQGNTSSLNVTHSISEGVMLIKIDGFPKDEKLEIDIMLQGSWRAANLENQSIFVNLKKDRGDFYG